MKKWLVLLIALVTVVSMMGCTKSASAYETAKAFNEKVATAPCKMKHEYVQDELIVDVLRDANENVKVTLTYADGTIEDFYRIDDTYTYYWDGELDTELYTVEEMTQMINDGLDEITYYPEDSITVFDSDIDSDVRENDEKQAFEAYGNYDINDGGGTPYTIVYGKDGTFYELIDDFDVIRIDLDDTVSVALPE